MKIIIDKSVAAWYEANINFENNTSLRFYTKMMRKTPTGFSLGVIPLEPTRVHTETVVNGIRYYIEEGDQWFFEGKNLKVTLGKHNQEPIYEIET